MSEYRNLFEEAVKDAPPSRIDVDQLIGRERRRARWRKAGAGVTVVAAVVAVTAIGLPIVRGDGTSGEQVAQGGNAAEATLETLLREVLPDAEFSPGDGQYIAAGANGSPFAYSVPVTPFDSEDSGHEVYTASINIDDDQGTSRFVLRVDGPREADAHPYLFPKACSEVGDEATLPQINDCWEEIGPNRETLVIVLREDGLGTGAVSIEVYVNRTDGTNYGLYSGNYGFGLTPGLHHVTRPSPALDATQLRKIALDPRLVLPEEETALPAEEPEAPAEAVERAAQLSGSFESTLQSLLPDATFTPALPHEGWPIDVPLFEFDWNPNGTYYTALDVVDDAGPGYLSALVSPTGTDTLPTTCDRLDLPASFPVAGCETSTGPDGETILTVTYATGEFHETVVVITATDGTGVMVHSSNIAGGFAAGTEFETPQRAYPLMPTRSAPPVDADQLLRIGLALLSA